MKILKAVLCSRHCTISLSLTSCCLPHLGRQLGILWPRESPSIQTLQDVTAQRLLEFRPVPPLPSTIRSYIVPSCSSSQCDGSVLWWPAWLCSAALQGWHCSTASHLMPLCILHSIPFMTSHCYQLCLLSCNHFKVQNQTNLQMLLF